MQDYKYQSCFWELILEIGYNLLRVDRLEVYSLLLKLPNLQPRPLN